MATTWIRAAKGIRFREHETRKHGIKKDKYYTIFYKYQGKDYSEGIGWSSDGVKQETCEQILMALRQNHKAGTGPKSYKEMREDNLFKEEQAKALAEHEKSLTIAAVFEDYLIVQTEKKERTIKDEKLLVKNHIEPFFGDISIKEIDTRKLDAFLKHLQDKISLKTGNKLSPASIRYCIAVLRQVWNYALSRDIVNIPFPLRAKQPRQDNRRTAFLSPEQAELLLETLKLRSVYVHDIALISLYCGLRLGEIFKLQWGDINFEQEYINIRDRKNKESGVAFIPKNVKTMLKARQSFGAARSNDFVFGNNNGSAKQFMSKTFTSVVEELGFNKDIDDRRKKIVFHSLRHTFASWLAQEGVSMFDLAELLGHKDIQMTQRYSHHSPDRLRKAAMLIENKKSQKAKIIQFDTA